MLLDLVRPGRGPLGEVPVDELPADEVTQEVTERRTGGGAKANLKRKIFQAHIQFDLRNIAPSPVNYCEPPVSGKVEKTKGQLVRDLTEMHQKKFWSKRRMAGMRSDTEQFVISRLKVEILSNADLRRGGRPRS